MTEYIDYELATTAVLKNYNRWITELFRPYANGSIVEFGAGIGTISKLLVPLASHMTLVEPSVKLCQELELKFGANDKIDVRRSSLQTAYQDSDRGIFDCAVLVNVLEHIEDDDAALRQLGNILLPCGYLLIFVPTHQALFSKFDQAVGHHRRYNAEQLRQKRSAVPKIIRNWRKYSYRIPKQRALNFSSGPNELL